MKKIILKTLIILFSSIVIGFLLLVLVYLLPVKSMKENVKESIPIFQQQGVYYNVITQNYATQLDNFTDSLMLQHAIYNGDEGVLNKTINVYRYVPEEYVPPFKSLINTIDVEEELLSKVGYDRYWHGYLIFLKPLLMVFNYSKIKLINVLLQTILISYIIYSFVRKKQIKSLIAYILSLVCIYPMVISLSLQFSTMFYIFNFGVLFVLNKNNWLNRNNNYLYFFLTLGIVTSYIDFLTYPLLSLGIPLSLYLLFNYQKSFFKNLKIIMLSGIFWSLGYIGMLVSKWCVGSVLLGKNLIGSALNQVLFRTSSSSFVSRFNTIKVNFAYFKFLFDMCLILLIIYIIIKLLKREIRFETKNIIKYFPILLLGIMPLVWYIVTSNHALTHAWFTYRNLFIFSFSLFSYILLLFEDKKI